MADFIPTNDATYKTWLANFAAKCETYESLVNFNVEELKEINDENDAYSIAMTELDAAKLNARTKTANKDSSRRSSSSLARAYAKKVKGTPGVTNAILTDFGILASSTVGPVTTVTGLNAVGCDDGVNKLRWNRSGNAQGTMFIIETSPNGLSGWELVDVTTKTTYDHDDQVPGERQFYRIKSKRSDVTSPACPPEVVYANGGEEGITLAA